MRRHATRSVRGGFGSFDLPISAMRASSGITPHAQGIRSGPTGGGGGAATPTGAWGARSRALGTFR